MDDIISQIIAIDSTVYEDQKLKEETFKSQKKAFDEKIQDYKNSRLSDAQNIAAKIASDTAAEIELKNQRLEEQKQIIHDEIDKKYIEVKDSLIDKVMNKLFVMG